MADFRAFETRPRLPRTGLAISLAGVLIIVAYMISMGVTSTAMSKEAFWQSLMLYGGTIALISGGLIYTFKKQRLANNTLAEFLVDNGWDFEAHPTPEHVATSLLGVGDNRGAGLCFGGSYYGIEMHAVTYVYTTGSEESRQAHNFTNLSFDLGMAFPLILLDDKHNDLMFSTDLPAGIQGAKPMRLEGDFNKRFNVSVLPETQREVLQLLTPDFMHELYVSEATANIEIEGNRLFIISKAIDFDETNLRNLFGMADIALKNIAEVSDSWQASSSAATVQAMAARAMTPRSKL